MQSFSGNTIDFTSMTCTSRADSDIKIFTNNYISIAITRELFMPTSIVWDSVTLTKSTNLHGS